MCKGSFFKRITYPSSAWIGDSLEERPLTHPRPIPDIGQYFERCPNINQDVKDVVIFHRHPNGYIESHIQKQDSRRYLRYVCSKNPKLRLCIIYCLYNPEISRN